jgi:hypothetical protein
VDCLRFLLEDCGTIPPAASALPGDPNPDQPQGPARARWTLAWGGAAGARVKKQRLIGFLYGD